MSFFWGKYWAINFLMFIEQVPGIFFKNRIKFISLIKLMFHSEIDFWGGN